MSKEELINSITTIISDYRAGDGTQMTPAHVNRWISQFPESVQLPILSEMNHVLSKTYFSKGKIDEFLTTVLTAPKLAGENPPLYWSGVSFLDIQQGGNSQHEMLQLLNAKMNNLFGIQIRTNNADAVEFVYLDDAIYTGNRVRRDLELWLETSAPQKSKIHIISIAYFCNGQYYADQRIKEKAQQLGKSVETTWWRMLALEDRKKYSNVCDVLRPVSIPNSFEVQSYINSMSYSPLLRAAGNVGENGLFSSDEAKQLLEREFLEAGVRIRGLCPNLGASSRPLGHMSLESVGFGAMLVTFRNCPNNAPLALWVSSPWYPLFPRTTNSDSAVRRIFQAVL